MSAIDVAAPIIEAMESRYPERTIARTVITHIEPMIRADEREKIVKALRKRHNAFKDLPGPHGMNVAADFIEREFKSGLS